MLGLLVAAVVLLQRALRAAQMEQMAATVGLARLQVFPGHPYLMQAAAAAVPLHPQLLAQAVLGVAARGQVVMAQLPQEP
jgi:hypothetical protein